MQADCCETSRSASFEHIASCVICCSVASTHQHAQPAGHLGSVSVGAASTEPGTASVDTKSVVDATVDSARTQRLSSSAGALLVHFGKLSPALQEDQAQFAQQGSSRAGTCAGALPQPDCSHLTLSQGRRSERVPARRGLRGHWPRQLRLQQAATLRRKSCCLPAHPLSQPEIVTCRCAALTAQSIRLTALHLLQCWWPQAQLAPVRRLPAGVGVADGCHLQQTRDAGSAGAARHLRRSRSPQLPQVQLRSDCSVRTATLDVLKQAYPAHVSGGAVVWESVSVAHVLGAVLRVDAQLQLWCKALQVHHCLQVLLQLL